MKTLRTICPALAVALLLSGLAFATEENEDIYYQEPTLPPNLRSNDETPPPSEVDTNGWRLEEEAANGEIRRETEPSDILLPVPVPVEQPRNGKPPMNRDQVLDEDQSMNRDQVLNGEHRKDANGEAGSGNGDCHKDKTNGEAEYRNGESQSPDTQRPAAPQPYSRQHLKGTTGEIELRNDETPERPLNGDMNGELEDQAVPGWPLYPYEERMDEGTNGDAEALPYTYEEYRYYNGELRPETDGEWMEVEPNGEDVVEPYDPDAESMNGNGEYRNGENGDNGWYEEDDRQRESIEDRTGYRFGFPGQK